MSLYCLYTSDQAIHYIDTTKEDNIDLMLIGSHLRLDRPGSITTAEQYRYIYQVSMQLACGLEFSDELNTYTVSVFANCHSNIVISNVA